MDKLQYSTSNNELGSGSKKHNIANLGNDVEETPAKRIKREVDNFEVQQKSAETQVNSAQMMSTEIINCVNINIPLPSEAIWCRWANEQICISTQTPVKNKRPRARLYKLSKGTPPLFDPRSGLEISSQTSQQSVVEEEAVKLSISRSDSNSAPGHCSKQVQTIEAELIKTEKIICSGNSTLPQPSAWGKWIDGRISLGSQTPTKRIRKRPWRKAKRSPPLVDPLTGLKLESGNTSIDFSDDKALDNGSESEDLKLDVDEMILDELMQDIDSSSVDSTQLCIVEHQDAYVQVDLPLIKPKSFLPNFKQGPSVANWSYWPDGRQCRSSQTALNRKTKKRKQRERNARLQPSHQPTWSSISPNLKKS